MSSGNPNPQNPGQNNNGPHPHQAFLDAVEWSQKYNGTGNNQPKPATDSKTKQAGAEQTEDNSINWIRIIIVGVVILVIIFLINYFYKKPDPLPNTNQPNNGLPQPNNGMPQQPVPPQQPIHNPPTVQVQ